jgi:hypothetical protein
MAGGKSGDNKLASRNYFIRQAKTLIKFAQTTSDPQMTAALVQKADQLKSQIDEAEDLSPKAPDVEPPADTGQDGPKRRP